MKRDINTLEDYLKMMADMEEQAGYHNAVFVYTLNGGRQFQSSPLTPEEQAFAESLQLENLVPNNSYLNCQTEALRLLPPSGITLQYVEGFIAVDGIPIALHRAWLSVNGKVWDLNTLIGPVDADVMGIIPDGWEYFGVEMDPTECRHAAQHWAGAPIIDDPNCGWPKICEAGTSNVDG